MTCYIYIDDRYYNQKDIFAKIQKLVYENKENILKKVCPEDKNCIIRISHTNEQCNKFKLKGMIYL